MLLLRWPLTMRVRTSVRYASGSMAFSLQVSIKDATVAKCSALPSEPANSAFLRLSAIGRMDRSMVLLSSSMRPSPMKIVRPSHRGLSGILCLRRVDHHEFTKRSLKMMVNGVFASDHSRGGRFHSAAARLRDRYSNFVAASSFGKWPLARTARRNFELSASMALVV